MIHPDDDVLADLALEMPVEDDAGARAHLDACGTCVERVQAYRETIHLVRDDSGVEAVEPPPGTWSAVRAAIAADGPSRLAPPSALATDGGPSRSRWWWLGGGVAAGLAAGVVAGSVVFSRDDPRTTPAAAAPTTTPTTSVVADAALTSPGGGPARGEASLVRDDRGIERLEVRVPQMSPPAAGEVHEVWLLHRDGRHMVSLGLMPDRSDAAFPVPAALLGRGYEVVDVSREALGGDAGHSGDSLLRGRLGT